MSKIFDWLKSKYQKLDQATQPIQNRVVSNFRQSLPTRQNFQRQIAQPIQRNIIRPTQNYYQGQRQKQINLAQQHPTIAKLNQITSYPIRNMGLARPLIIKPISKDLTSLMINKMPEFSEGYTPDTKLTKYLMGDEKINPSQKSWAAKKTGVPILGTAAVVGSLGLDATIGGSGKGFAQRAFKTISKTEDATKIARSLRTSGLKIGEDLIPSLTKKLIKSKDAGQISNIVNKTINTAKQIHPEDKQIMAQFIDAVRSGKPTGGQLSQDVQRIADHYGLWDRKTQSLGDLVGTFDTELRKTATNGIEFLRKGAGQGNRYAGSKIVKEYVPKIVKQTNNPMYGGVAGMEYEKDENGKLRVKFNPYKAMGGIAVMGGVKNKDAFIKPFEAGAGRKVLRLLTSGKAELQKMGEGGKQLANTILDQRKAGEMMKGKYEVALQNVMKGLSKDERILAGQVREGLARTNDPRILKATEGLKTILDHIGNKAQQVGLKIKTAAGEVPFKLRENYMPRVYDFDKLQKAAHREKLLQHLVDTGQAQNISDASKIFDNFIKDNTVRRAGNLEHARELDLPGYELDPLQSVGKYISSASNRLTEATSFGTQDELAKNFIEKIRQDGGDEKYAQEVFDLMTGQKKYKNVGVDLATKFNYITKLDLGFITNATQPINTAAKTGIINTINGIFQAYVTPNKAGKFARSIGAVTDDITKGKAEGLTMGRIMETILSPFSYVERKNRVISAVAGKKYAESLANKLLKNPDHAIAIRQLKSLGIEPEKIIAQGKILPEDILGAAKTTADTTQFKVDAIDIPPGWKTNIGRMLSQFRSFTFKQTQFVRDEMLKEAAKGNVVPLLRFIVLAVPASFVAQSVRNKLTGRDQKSSEKSLDVRKLDMYLKAVGTMPTDMITQGKFLYDTYKNPYATPLKKVGRTVSSLLGPTVGEGFSIVNAIEQAGTQRELNKDLPKGKNPTDPYLEAKRIAAGYVPFVGEYAKNKLFSYPTDNKSDFSRVITAIKNKDDNALTKVLATYDAKSRGSIVSKALEIVRGEGGNTDIQSNQTTSIVLRKQQAIDDLEASGNNFKDYGDFVARKDTEGKATIMSKDAYNVSLYGAQLTSYKKNDNLQAWGEVADKQREALYKQLRDPQVDELDKVAIQNKIDTLEADMAKFASYGGFKKGKKAKKAKKPKKISLTLSAPKRANRVSITSKLRKPTAPKISLISQKTGGSSGTQTSGGQPRSLRTKKMF